jgi:hypothetical protein
MQNHTHTDYSHHWYIRTRLQCGHIFMTRYAKSHTHIDLARRLSILLAGRRSCCTWSLNKIHLCWWLRELIPSLQWDHKAFWTCTFVFKSLPRVEGERIGKIMIIGQRMKDCLSWKQWSLDTRWKLSILMPGGFGLPPPDTATRKEYVTRILPAAVLEGWATQSPPITRILLATERSRRKKREKQKLVPYKIYSLRHS